MSSHLVKGCKNAFGSDRIHRFHRPLHYVRALPQRHRQARHISQRGSQAAETSLQSIHRHCIRLLPTAVQTSLLLIFSYSAWAVWPSLAAGSHVDVGSVQHYQPQEIHLIASNEDFWQNLGRYGRYFITVLLGTAYTAIRPIGKLLTNPITAGLVVAVAIGLYFFVSTTLNGMLGVNQAPLDLSFS